MSGQQNAPVASTEADSEENAQLDSGDTSVNMVELREIAELIATHGFTDFELEREGFRIRLRRELPSSDATSAPFAAPQHNSPLHASQAANQVTAPLQSAQSGVSSLTDSTVASGSATGQDEGTNADLHTITSPIVGTFYRSPSPTADPFVHIGTNVGPDMVVCIVEAMKLMNEILAETSGTVEKIYVENGQPVEYGQPLFGVRR